MDKVTEFTGMTTAKYSDLLKTLAPEVWKWIGMKHVDVPAGYSGLGLVANTFASAVINMLAPDFNGTADQQICADAQILMQYDYPTYFVGRDLLQAMLHTKAPDLTWNDVFWPYPGVIFMLPENVIIEKPTNKPVNFIGVCRLPAGNIPLHLPNHRCNLQNEVDRVSVFWGVDGGSIAQDLTLRASNPLQPPAEWLKEATEHAIARQRESHPDYQPQAVIDHGFGSYAAGLAANLLLLMSARKHLVETGKKTGKTLKSGRVIHTPSWLGRKYEIIKNYPQSQSPKAHFTELGWRSGYLAKRHTGKGGTDIKIVLVDPYIAYTRGLVRESEDDKVA